MSSMIVYLNDYDIYRQKNCRKRFTAFCSFYIYIDFFNKTGSLTLCHGHHISDYVVEVYVIDLRPDAGDLFDVSSEVHTEQYA